MIYFVLFSLGVITSMYWFIAGSIFGKLGEKIAATENKWERLAPWIFAVVFWPIGCVLGWLVHTYGPCGLRDVEPVDECPRCGLEL